MTQQTFRIGRGFVELAIAATALTGFTLMASMAPGQATERPTPVSSEQPISHQAVDLGESMQAACIAVTPLQSRPDCPTEGDLFLSADSEDEIDGSVMRFDLQEVKEEKTDVVVLLRISF
jgi:hypothetical protein